MKGNTIGELVDDLFWTMKPPSQYTSSSLNARFYSLQAAYKGSSALFVPWLRL